MSYVFVSYSRADERFARGIAKLLKESGYLIWIDYKDLDLNRPLANQLIIAIEKADMFLLVSSPFSQLSEWVNFELALAKSRQKIINAIYVPHTKYANSIVQSRLSCILSKADSPASPRKL